MDFQCANSRITPKPSESLLNHSRITPESFAPEAPARGCTGAETALGACRVGMLTHTDACFLEPYNTLASCAPYTGKVC